ncbi:tripartite tricarboxylate transporter TctB family protein [Ornithinicoccus hortensis]|uniref:Tripartite tricarboxylate transporter TctB family protein n=1 Tax=Ornithinicoccus hortensis TaxID=82346 RepID=A0A542YUM9_9MICO|nr:tripartite tricarboxylate transporter TctB family protein [Ornithinicoccus hortensis]TQL51783.1 tripartite tricarboxylate transporter TctB family protein [Ornithinicoccus hortensis]
MTAQETEHQATRPRPETSDVVGTVILGVVGAVAVVMGLGYGFTVEGGQVGPGFLPVLTGGFIVVAAVLELIRMFFASSSPIEGSFMETVENVEEEARAAIEEVYSGAEAPEAAAGEELDTFGRTQRQRSTAMVKIFALILAALLLIPVLGLLISLSAMTLALLIFVERRPWLTSLLATLGALAFFYLVFVQGLRVPLPTGMLGII